MWRHTPLKEGAGYGRLKRQQEQEVLAPAADEEEEEEDEDESEYETDSEDEGVGRAMLKPVFVPKVSGRLIPQTLLFALHMRRSYISGLSSCLSVFSNCWLS